MAPAMLGMMLLGFVVFVGILTAFTGVLQGGMIEALTDIPTMHAYAPDGTRITEVSQSVMIQAEPLLAERQQLRDDMSRYMTTAQYEQIEAAESAIDEINYQLQQMRYVDDEGSILTLYRWFAAPSVTILLLIIVFSAAAHFWEKGLGWWRRGMAHEMFRTSVIGIIAIILLPELWDIYAIYMEQMAVYFIHPVELNPDPQMVIDQMWCKMGASAGCMLDFAGLLDPVSWSTALASPADFGQSLLGEILLPYFKLMPAFVLMMSAYVVGEVRSLLMAIVLVTFPMWMVLRNLPFMRKHGGDMVMVLVGGSFAPLMSGITLYSGWSYVASHPMPSLEEWVSVFGIIVLAGIWPVLLVPFLRDISGKADAAISTAVQSSGMMAMQIGMGAAGGAMAGAQSKDGGFRNILGGALTGGGQSMIGAMPREVLQLAPAAKSAGSMVEGTRFGRPQNDAGKDAASDPMILPGGWSSPDAAGVR